MTTYTYHIDIRYPNGRKERIGMGTEGQMFTAAVDADNMGCELLEAAREVWNVKDGVAKFVRFDYYRNGKPVVLHN